jgi:hypothetical protein
MLICALHHSSDHERLPLSKKLLLCPEGGVLAC